MEVTLVADPSGKINPPEASTLTGVEQQRKEKKKLYFALDLEGTGDKYKAPIVSIGVFVGCYTEGGMIEKRRFSVKLSALEELFIEPRCLSEFWFKVNEKTNDPSLRDIWDTIQDEGTSTENMTKDFVAYLHYIDEKFSLEYDIIIISDNPAYDVARTDYLITKLDPDMYPLRFSREGKYRWIEDPSEQEWGQGVELKKYCELICPHNHLPDNDAENHFWRLAFTKIVRNEYLRDTRRSEIIKILDSLVSSNIADGSTPVNYESHQIKKNVLQRLSE